MLHPFEKCKDSESVESMSLRKNEPAARTRLRVAGSVFSSSLFAYGHFQLRNIELDFSFTFGAVQREVLNHRIFIYFGSGFIATIWKRIHWAHSILLFICDSFIVGYYNMLMCDLSSNKLHMPCVHLTNSVAENIYICLVMTCQKNCFTLRSKVLYQMTQLGNAGFVQSIKWFI